MKKVKLGEVCEIRIGKTPNRSQTLYWGGDYPWLSISDMKGKILCTTKEKITQEAVQKEKMQIVSKGTVVMSFKLSIGKVGILAENMYTNEAIANFVVKNNKMLFNEYLYYALQGMNFDSLTDRAVMGRTLNKAKLNNLSIVYNEPFMQQQIVLRLDGVNKLIESRKQQLSELSKLVKSRFNEMFGDLLLNEFKWDYASFNEFAKFDTKMIYDFTNFIDLPHIGIDSIEKNTGKLIGYRTVGEDQISSGKYLFTKKHIIYSKIRPNLNKVALPDFMGVCSADAYPILTVDEKMNRIFLAHVLRSDYFLNFILSFSSRTNLPKVNKSQISKFKCPLPPLSLQNEFADFVAQVDKSQLAIQKSLEELETLKKSLMQEYFG